MSERSLVGEMVDELLRQHCTIESVTAAEAAGFDPELWARLEELGLTLPAVSERFGGQGATLDEQREVLQAAGRAAAPVPLAETGLLAGWLLEKAGSEVPAGPLTVVSSPTADRPRLRRGDDGLVLSGRVRRVPYASIAKHLVVLAQDEDEQWQVARVAARACVIAPGRDLAAEPRDEVCFEDVRLDVGAVVASPVDGEALRRRESFGRSVLMLGAMEAVHDMTIDHTRQREQFRRRLADFQAVQQTLAILAREVALARAAVGAAAEAILVDDDLSLLSVVACRTVCERAAARVAASAHQLHGAIGITREHGLQLLTRRLWSWRDDGVPAAVWTRALGRRLLSEPDDLWSFVTAADAAPRPEAETVG
jgi:acyl-CoA dehydrogenase